MLRRALLTLLLFGVATFLFVRSWDDAGSALGQWWGVAGVCACFFALVLFDQRIPNGRVLYHRLKLVALCCAAFLILATVPYAVADDWDPALVVDPKLLYLSGAFALAVPMVLVLVVSLIPLGHVVAVSRKSNIVLFGVVSALLVLEVFLRLRSPAPPPLTNQADRVVPYVEGPGGSPLYIMRPDHDYVLAFRSNPRGYFDDGNRITHHVNAASYRGPVRSVDKPPDVYRIMILGDSYAFGFGIKEKDTPGVLLAEQLEGVVPDKRVEIITLAAPGYTTRDERDVYREFGAAYSADLVILWYAINDVADDWSPFSQDSSRPDWEKPWYLRASQALATFESAVTRGVRQRRYPRDLANGYRSDVKARFSGNWTKNKAAIRELQAATAAQGTRLIVVIEPSLGPLAKDQYRYAPAHATIRAFCDEAGLSCYDLWDPIIGKKQEDLWVHPSDQHSNEIANRIYADFLAEKLQSDRVLPR